MDYELHDIKTVGELINFLKQYNEDDKVIYDCGGDSLHVYALEGEKNLIVF